MASKQSTKQFDASTTIKTIRNFSQQYERYITGIETTEHPNATVLRGFNGLRPLVDMALQQATKHHPDAIAVDAEFIHSPEFERIKRAVRNAADEGRFK